MIALFTKIKDILCIEGFACDFFCLQTIQINKAGYYFQIDTSSISFDGDSWTYSVYLFGVGKINRAIPLSEQKEAMAIITKLTEMAETLRENFAGQNKVVSGTGFTCKLEVQEIGITLRIRERWINCC